MKKTVLASLLIPLFSGLSWAADTPYANAIKALEPTYYYELNETSIDEDAIDSMGNASEPGFFNGEYGEEGEGFAVVGCAGPLILNDIPTAEENPDFVNTFEYFPQPVPGVGGEENRAHCSYNVGHVELGPAEEYGAAAITVSLFFRHEGPQGGTSGDRLFTNNLTDPATSFQVDTAGEGLVVAVNPNDSGELAERTLFTVAGDQPDRALINGDYGWFHVVASTFGEPDERAGNIRVWVNGLERTDNLEVTNWGWGVDTDIARIGGRRDDAADSTTHIGAQDEVAIWLDRVLTEEEVQSIWTAAIGGAPCTPGTGDIDGDGRVEFADFLILSANFGQDGGAAEGDLDCNGKVEFADFLTLSGNFGQDVGAAQSVPEPAALSLMMLGAIFVGVFRRRRN